MSEVATPFDQEFGLVADLIRPARAARPGARGADRCPGDAELRRARRVDGPHRRQPAARRRAAARCRSRICAAASVTLRGRLPRRLARRRCGGAAGARRHAATAWPPCSTTAGAKLLFVDAAAAEAFAAAARRHDSAHRARRLGRRAEPSTPGWRPRGAPLAPVDAGARLGLQHHLFVRHDRHAQGHRAAARACAGRTCGAAARPSATARTAITLLSTPLYSNTTLVVVLPDPRLGRHGGR